MKKIIFLNIFFLSFVVFETKYNLRDTVDFSRIRVLDDKKIRDLWIVWADSVSLDFYGVCLSRWLPKCLAMKPKFWLSVNL